MAIMQKMGTQFGVLIHHLVKGNMKKAGRLADSALNDTKVGDPGIVVQNLIETLAQEQAFKNGCLNLPSLFPGIGTLISFWLLGARIS